MHGLALCAGIGGLELGVRAALHGYRTACYVERDPYACAVLMSRMWDGGLDEAPIWDDLTTFDATAWRGRVDLVTAGYPCQPFSIAGKRLGTDDPRHLWPHVARVLDECRPTLAFFENVPGHLQLGFADVLADLAALGFDAEWGLFAAAEVGAPHKRERLFILAHSNRPREPQPQDGPEHPRGEVGDTPQQRWREGRTEPTRIEGRSDAAEPGREGVGDAVVQGLAQRDRQAEPAFPAPWPPGPADADGWRDWIGRGGPQPVLRRGVDGPAAWLDRRHRLRCLGNGVVPAQATRAFRELSRRIGLNP